MNITLNGESRVIAATTLTDALTEAGYGDAVVATAVNGNFVPQGLRAGLTLSNGDAIEVLAPMQGG
ncbi:sulfur carrier protein ThiS [Puniceibacterium sp. IMCC21224]|uniref:sulfur carrier protein ThiS n=1 Tax=Puniceibacterium sp. IMCC21224 TaxID=1618204 RepID=UPI00064D8352|nr:sulfur carrier protein ThiS [Puniceibacterium sp. IMCC21224]KMK66199.1 thiamine biosynthesis protein ThiS [Puniceibacterium sp. IMCC21224]